MNSQPPKLSQIGKQVEGVRKIVQVNQETLSKRLKMSRPAYYKLLQEGNIDSDMLQRIADALGVPIESIENYSAEKVLNYIQNNHDHTQANNIFGNNNNLNSTEGLMAVVAKNEGLYERMLKSLQDQIEFLKTAQKK